MSIFLHKDQGVSGQRSEDKEDARENPCRYGTQTFNVWWLLGDITKNVDQNEEECDKQSQPARNFIWRNQKADLKNKNQV